MDELEYLQKQILELEDSLLFIETRISEYVDRTTIPLTSLRTRGGFKIN